MKAKKVEITIEVSVLAQLHPLVHKVEKKLEKAGLLITARERTKTRTRITGVLQVSAKPLAI